jgi:hypothetical protein
VTRRKAAPRCSAGARCSLLVAAVGLWTLGAGDAADPLAAELARWSSFARGTTSTDQMWVQARDAVLPVLDRARRALQDGRRFLALMRLESAHQNLAAASYMLERPAEERASMAAFEAEWRRIGAAIGSGLAAPGGEALAGVQPSALRALGEAALPQVRVYYEASLEYGRSTQPESGLFYLGAAQAQREFAAFCRTLSTPSPRAVSLRPLGPDLDGLEGELLAAYRPPASIDKHREFIGISSALKEARELDALGLRHGALLRYLQAALRFGPLRPVPASDAATLSAALVDVERRLAGDARDVSLGRLFLEVAQDDLAGAAEGQAASTAAAVARDVLPRYFAALEPAKPAPPRPEPRVTVTLVRWPYT